MVILGGLELVAAGYLINRHQKNKQEARRLQEEEDLLEEQRYRIYSANDAGPGRRRSYSHDRHNRHERKHSHHRHHSHDRRHSRDDRRDDRKYNYEQPQRESRPHASSAPPPMYAATAPPSIAAQAMRTTAPPAMVPLRPPVSDPNYPPTGWPAHWEQSQKPPGNPQPQAAQMPPNLAPYYRDPAQSDVKYGFRDEEDDTDRGRSMLSPSDANRGAGEGHSRARRGSSSRSVRFDVPNGRQPGDESPPAYMP